MPTYDYKCQHCGEAASIVQSIGEYSRAPIRPACNYHGTMERYLSVVPGMSGLANALAGDRHYDGLRSTDGADISTRTKHREYMKAKGLTMADDFKGVWAKAQQEREAIRAGNLADSTRRKEIEQAVMTAINK